MTKYQDPEAKFLREAIRHKTRCVAYDVLSALVGNEDVQRDEELREVLTRALDATDRLRRSLSPTGGRSGSGGTT